MITAGDAILEIQAILEIPPEKRAPRFGPLSAERLQMLHDSDPSAPWPPLKRTNRILTGDGSFPWTVEIVGDDIVVRNAKATWFGGSNDPQDSGETASGCGTRGRPDLLAASLPMDYRGSHRPTRQALMGSPIPMMPFGLDNDCNPRKDGAWVEVTFLKTGAKITIPVIDLGPAKTTGNALDLSVAAFKQFAPIVTGKIICDYRIIGAARYAKT